MNSSALSPEEDDGNAQRRRTPNPNTYWVIPGRFLAGEYPDDMLKGTEESTRVKIGGYLDIANITTFVDLTEEGERDDYMSIVQEEASKRGRRMPRHVRFPIRDYSVPTKEQMKSILDMMDEALEKNGENVYVHCWGGKGRTGTVVGSYIARHRLSPQPVEYLQRLFRAAGRSGATPEMPEQVDFVRNWDG